MLQLFSVYGQPLPMGLIVATRLIYRSHVQGPGNPNKNLMDVTLASSAPKHFGFVLVILDVQGF